MSGAVHYFRNLPDTWDDIFEKLVALGCNCVETYCVWNMHEKVPGEYDFSGMLDVKAFLEKAQAHGLYAIVRPGPKMMRKKGRVGRVLLDKKVHFGWKAYPLPMDNLDKPEFKAVCEAGSLPFHKFEFGISQPCNTFLKLEGFGNGFAELNGFNLGRYWKIGPQRTLFVPKSVLKEGKNTLIVFDSEGAVLAPSVEFVDKPELE